MSANRLSLFRTLEAAQIPATCGGEHNFALEAAVAHMQLRTAQAMRGASLTMWPMLPRLRRQTAHVALPPSRRLWEPSVSRRAPSSIGPLIACDGSFDQSAGIGAYAVVSSTGAMYATTAMCASSGDVELLALIAGMELGIENRGGAPALLTDSLDAVDRLEHMIHDHHPPRGTKLGGRLNDVRRQLSSDVIVHHVRGRTGNRLHDAADAIALAVRRGATIERETIEEQLEGIVDEWVSIARGTSGHDLPGSSIKRIVVSPLD